MTESENVSDRFDRLPETASERTVSGRATRAEVVSFFTERYGIPSATFANHTFWERGSGKIWAFAGDAETPMPVEALGMTVLRTRQEHWKPTLEAAQRFGKEATRNCIHLSREKATVFFAGTAQEVAWDGDWGFLFVTQTLAGETEPLGVGLYVHGELRSMVPKGRRRTL